MRYSVYTLNPDRRFVQDFYDLALAKSTARHLHRQIAKLPMAEVWDAEINAPVFSVERTSSNRLEDHVRPGYEGDGPPPTQFGRPSGGLEMQKITLLVLDSSSSMRALDHWAKVRISGITRTLPKDQMLGVVTVGDEVTERMSPQLLIDGGRQLEEFLSSWTPEGGSAGFGGLAQWLWEYFVRRHKRQPTWTREVWLVTNGEAPSEAVDSVRNLDGIDVAVVMKEG